MPESATDGDRTGRSVRPRLVLVTNAAAGSADDEAVGRALTVLRAQAEVERVATRSVDDLRAVVGSLGARRLVVAGGDGSLHAVVQTLYDAGRLAEAGPLGLVPLGTGNDLARALAVPLDPEEAAAALLGGRARPLDLLVDSDGGVVVNAVHVGVGAEAAEEAQTFKARLGAAAYAVGSLVAGVRTPGWRLQVLADGRRVADVDRRCLMVGLGNGTSVGGGAELTPDAAPDDGLADVVVSFSVGPLARLGYAIGLKRGTHVERGDVVVTRAREVVVRGQSVPVNADGELAGEVRELTWRVVPAAWSLLVPSLPGGQQRGDQGLGEA